jgi:hypothetical protein
MPQIHRTGLSRTRGPLLCARLAHPTCVKNITLSADEALIEGARRRAEAENTSLNNVFREWLARYAERPRLPPEDVRRAAEAAGQFRAGRRFTREERNERQVLPRHQPTGVRD